MLIEKLKSFGKTSEQVEFFCEPADFGVIAEPYSARKLMPEWYKHLTPRVDNREVLNNATVKRCAPFLDAMTTGWIIPLAADVVFATNSDASGIEYRWKFYRDMIEKHGPEQIAGHPEQPKPPMKWMNYIFIKIPKNHVALFVPPLNRPDPRFECFSGMVDWTYMGHDNIEYINFPFVFKVPNYTGIVKKGTPLVQMFVFPDEGYTWQKKTPWRIQTGEEQEIHMRTKRRREAHESHYRDYLWKRK